MDEKEHKRVCCNCDHRISRGASDYCEIDGHGIGYAEVFCGWCRRWKQGYLEDGRKNR